MTTFLAPARGGIQPINGKAGAISAESAAADKGKPGRETIIHELNRIAEAARIQMLMSNCDPQSQLQKVQQQVQRQVQQVIEQRIGEIIQQEVSTNQDLKSIQERLQSIQQQAQSQGLNQSLQQQAEIANKELQSQISKVIVGAIGKASQQMSQAAKIAISFESVSNLQL